MKQTSTSMLLWALSILFCFFVVSCDRDQKPSTNPETDSSPGEAAAKIDHIDATGAATLLASDHKPIVIDLRTPEEFGAGHIEGATMIDFKAPDFETKLAELDRDQPYLIHCRSGGRSTSSLPIFEKLGFNHVIHLDGGFNGWQEAGNPVVK